MTFLERLFLRLALLMGFSNFLAFPIGRAVGFTLQQSFGLFLLFITIQFAVILYYSNGETEF